MVVLIDIRAMVPSHDFCHEGFLGSRCLAQCLSTPVLRWWSIQIMRVLDNVLDNIMFLVAYRKMSKFLIMTSEHDLAPFSISDFLLLWFSAGLPAVVQTHPTVCRPCVLGASCCLCLKCPCLYVWWILTHLSGVVSSSISFSVNPFQPLPSF